LRPLILTLTCLALIVFSLPALAGPLTGAPAIKFELGAPEPGMPAPSNWALGVGYTNFTFELGLAGQTYSWSQGGPIISGEYVKQVGEEGNKSVAFGGWLAPVGSTTKDGIAFDSMTMGEVHFRYGFNRNWGVEVGTLIADAADSLGKLMIHAVWQTESSSEKPVKTQVGLGIMQGTEFEGVLKCDAGASLYANVSYPFSESISGYLSLWMLVQSYKWQGQYAGLPDVDVSTLQWSIGASHAF
jgi:hypothetical protein